MGRHRVPRSPRRRLLIGGASLTGVAVAAVLGLTYTNTVNVDIPTPFAASPSSPPPSEAAGTTTRPPVHDPLTEPWVDELVASLTPPAPEPAPSPTETPEPIPTEASSQPVPEPEEVEEAQEVEETAAPSSTVNDPLTETEEDHELHLNPPPPDWSGAWSPSSTVWSAWAPDVRPQVWELANGFSIETIYTRPGHSPDQEHAADFMTTDVELGNRLAAYALQMPGVEYVIWQQRYNDGSGWVLMEDRGGVTANHYDHVHVSFH